MVPRRNGAYQLIVPEPNGTHTSWQKYENRFIHVVKLYP